MKRILQGWNKIDESLSAAFLTITLILVFYEVVGRYLFQWPVYFAEDIVRYTIIWATFFGVSLLVHQEGHVAADFLKNRLSAERRQLWELIIAILGLVFTGILAFSGFGFLEQCLKLGTVSDTPLRMPMFYPVLILPIGGILLSLRFVEKIIKYGRLSSKVLKDPLTYVTFLALAIPLFLYFNGSGPLVLLFVTMIEFILLGMPIAFALGLPSILIMVAFGMSKFAALSSKMFWSLDNFTLLAIPLFTIAGEVLAHGKMGGLLLELTSSIFKPIRGGMGMATVAASTIFAAMSGSSAASATAMGKLTFSSLLEGGYPRKMVTALLAAGGTLAILIPPSTILVVYGSAAGVSVSDLFKASIIPGLLLAGALCVLTYILCKLNNYGPPQKGFSIVETGRSFKRSIWALLMPVIILGSIYMGIATPTEAAAVGSVYAILVSVFIYKDVKLSNLVHMFKKAAAMSAMIYFVIMSANIFGFVVTYEKFADTLMELITQFNVGTLGFLLLINFAAFILGFFMGPIPIIMLLMPILLPVLGPMEINPIHLGILLTINSEIAMLTPPVGINLYVLSAITNTAVLEVVRGMVPFIITFVLFLIAAILFPQLSLLML